MSNFALYQNMKLYAAAMTQLKRTGGHSLYISISRKKIQPQIQSIFCDSGRGVAIQPECGTMTLEIRRT